jgi:hypothetical protein
VRRVARQIDEIIASRTLYVTTGASAETLAEVRRRMLEEKSVSLERAQALAAEIRYAHQNLNNDFLKEAIR